MNRAPARAASAAQASLRVREFDVEPDDDRIDRADRRGRVSTVRLPPFGRIAREDDFDADVADFVDQAGPAEDQHSLDRRLEVAQVERGRARRRDYSVRSDRRAHRRKAA